VTTPYTIESSPHKMMSQIAIIPALFFTVVYSDRDKSIILQLTALSRIKLYGFGAQIFHKAA
jgi:hypothetical protein